MVKGKTILVILAACAGLGVLLIGSCAGLLFIGFRNAGAVASPRVDAMFSAIEDETFAETYETETTQELRNAATKEQYESLGNAVAVRLGSLQSKTLREFYMRQVNADSYVDVTYDATFEKGDGTIVAQLKKQGDKWKFVTFHVNSSVFEQALATATCRSCGEPHSAKARFCPSCGADLSSDDTTHAPHAEPSHR
jgi:hypothetical protein